ncbi:MAG: OsmC family protein [Bryobacteraceae bacterium]
MGVLIEGEYIGKKKVRLRHEPSGAEIVTDAPRDNQGEGSAFSPTDLVAGALGACMMTIIAIIGERSGLDLAGMRMRVVKEMQDDPRRIARLPVEIHLPSHLSPEDRQKLERAAGTCPVARSLLPDIHVVPCFLYDV